MNGSVSDSVGTTIGLVVGVGIAVMVLIFVGTLGGQTYQLVENDIDAIGDNDVTLDTFTALNNTAVSLDHGDVQYGTLTIQNGTTAKSIIIELGNFTIDYNAGLVTLENNASNWWNNSVLYANYTWGNVSVRNSIKAGVVSGFEAVEQTGSYMPLIVLAVIIVLIMGLVLGMGYNGRGGPGSAL